MISSYKLLAYSGREDFQINVKIEITKKDLILHYELTGDLSNLSIPKVLRRDEQRRKLNLWEDTCFEFFLKRKNTHIYREFNFSPSREWNAFDFTSYRSDLLESTSIKTVEIAVEKTNDKMKLLTSLPLKPEDFSLVEYEVNLSGVLKFNDGSIEYFALGHPETGPDFHSFENFVELKRDR